MNTYYSTLGVPKTATMEEIKTAYRKLALKYHPKNNPNDEAAHAKFIAVNEAFNALSNEMKR
jgi:curved DNA-binding protein CbpA